MNVTSVYMSVKGRKRTPGIVMGSVQEEVEGGERT